MTVEAHPIQGRTGTQECDLGGSRSASAPPTVGQPRKGLRLSRDLPIWLAFLALDAGTQVAFKAGGKALAGIEFGPQWFERFVQSPAIWLGVIGYIVAFVIWIAILQGSDLTRAVSLTGLSFATVPLAGWVIFNEDVSQVRMLGIAIIIVGVTLITRPRQAMTPR